MDWGILDGLSADHRATVMATTRRRQFRRRSFIVRQGEVGDSLHLIDRGRAAVQVLTPGGDLITIAIIGPGAYFGEQALVGDRNLRMAAVVALEPVETLALHRSDFDRLREQEPSVNSVLVRALSGRVDRLTDRLIETLFVSAETRICRRLVELAAVYGRDGACSANHESPQTGEHLGGGTIELTQDELAGLAGTSRSTVNSVLAELSRAGIVTVRRGAVDVHDHIGLARRTEPD